MCAAVPVHLPGQVNVPESLFRYQQVWSATVCQSPSQQKRQRQRLSSFGIAFTGIQGLGLFCLFFVVGVFFFVFCFWVVFVVLLLLLLLLLLLFVCLFVFVFVWFCLFGCLVVCLFVCF